MTGARIPPVVRAAGWMMLTLCSFIAMAVAVRALSERMGTYEILFFRSALGLIILLPIMLCAGFSTLRTRRIRWHLARNVVHFGGQFSWTYAVPLLPLAQIFALEFTLPLWVGVLAWLFLGERLTRARLAALGIGFVGVLIILRPGLAGIAPASFIVLAAALGFAGSVVLVKSLTRTDHPLTIVFYMSLMQLPLGLVPALLTWVTPGAQDWPWLLLAGVSALSAHYSLARALRLADSTVVMPLEFLRVPLVAVVAYLLYLEPIDPWTLAGAAVIFAANFHLVWVESGRPMRGGRGSWL